MTPAAPRPTKDTVYVDAEDDITGIIDKVEGGKNKVVALVLPKRMAALQSIVNMRLLKRSAKNADKSVVLITSEKALLPLAGAAEVHVAKNLQSKPEIPPPPLEAGASEQSDNTDDAEVDPRHAIGDLAAVHGEGDAIDLGDDEAPAEEEKKSKTPKDKKLTVPNFDRFRLGLLGLFVAGFLLVFLLIFGLFVWPKATITIQTESTPVTANFTLDASSKAKKLNEAGGVVPAALKTTLQTATTDVQATGQKNNGDKATGSVTMTAQKCAGGTPNDVPAGAGVTTAGLTYITQAATSFHFTSISGGCANFSADSSTAITAQTAGAKYNVSSVTFAVAGRSEVSASGSASGGTDNNVTVVSQDDINGAKQKATGKDSSAFTKDFESQLDSQGYYVIDSTLKAASTKVTATPGVGQPASTSSVTVKVTYSVLVVQKSVLQKAITDELNKQIDTSKQKISSTDVVKDASVSVQSSSSSGEASLSISESTTAIPTLDFDAIKKQAEGLKKGDIQSFISNYPGVKSVNVKMSPFWVSKAPKKLSKIHIILQPAKSQ